MRVRYNICLFAHLFFASLTAFAVLGRQHSDFELSRKRELSNRFGP